MRRYKFGRPLLCLGLLLLAIGSYAAERIDGGSWANWNHALGFLLLGWYLWVFLRDHRAVVLTSFYQIYYSVGMLVSIAIIAGGAHMIEVDQHGTVNGAFWIMMIWFVTGMEMTYLGYRSGGRIHFGLGMRPLAPSIGRLLILFITGATLAMGAYVIITTGGPLLHDINRVMFWREMAPPGTSLLPSLVNQTFFFAAFYFLWQRSTSKSLLLPYLIVIGYVLTSLFVLGEKFGIFLIFLNAWLLLLPGMFPNFKFGYRNLVVIVFAMSIIVAYVGLSYVREGRELSFIITRAALQAQLLWSIFDDTNAARLLPNNPHCYFGCEPFELGANYISQRYLPEIIYNHYEITGSKLSGFMPALSIMTFGFIVSIIIHIIILFILGVLQRKITESAYHRNLIYTFLLFKVQFSITLIWFTSGWGALRGLIITLALIVAYRVIFLNGIKGNRWVNAYSSESGK